MFNLAKIVFMWKVLFGKSNRIFNSYHINVFEMRIPLFSHVIKKDKQNIL